MSKEKRVLVYRRGGLGDTLLVFPLLENFKKLGYKITFLGNSDYIEIAKLCGFSDEVYSAEFLNIIRCQSYEKEIIISFGGNLYPVPPKRIWLPYYFLQALNLPMQFSLKLPLVSSFFKRKKISQKLAVLHPGSGSPKKNPPLTLYEKIENYLKKLGYQVIYFAGIAEKYLLNWKTNVLSTENILDAIKLLLTIDLYIGNDSGLSHLASFMGVSSILIYGPSDDIIYRPIGENIKLITLPLSCRPCFPNVCEEKKCLDEEELWKAFKSIF
ncbi:MAG: glycosyltransferase family 9 protein [Caldimicrobium sp.]